MSSSMRQSFLVFHIPVCSPTLSTSPNIDSWLNTLHLQHSYNHNPMLSFSDGSSQIPTGLCPITPVSVPAPATDLFSPLNRSTDTHISSLDSLPLPTGPIDFSSPTTIIPTSSSDITISTTAILTSSSTVPLLNTAPTPVPEPISTDIPLPNPIPHLMQTRSKSGIVKPKLTYAALVDYTITEPPSYTVASKHSKWCTAMDEDDGSIARYKARLVAKGFHQQYGVDFEKTFNPVIKPPTVRLILSLALNSTFDLKDLGSLHYFLGLQITRSSSRLYITQSKYAQALLKKHNMLDCKPTSSPSCPNVRLFVHDGDLLIDPHAYRSMVGALHYLTFTRPDISFVMHQVCQYMSTPTTTHLAAAKRVLRYIKSPFNHGIEFTPGPLHLSAYTDADWAGDPDDRRSTSGFLVYLGNNAITWSAKKQPTVSRSSTESEYRALTIASAEICWVRSLPKDLGIYLIDPPILWCDNVSALAIASNPLIPEGVSHLTTYVKGTLGYLALEYAMWGKVSESCDMYNFGILLLEIVTGRKPIEKLTGGVKRTITEWAAPLITNARFKDLVDPKLRGNFDETQLKQAIDVAALCVQSDPENRPNMKEVVSLLKGHEQKGTVREMRIDSIKYMKELLALDQPSGDDDDGPDESNGYGVFSALEVQKIEDPYKRYGDWRITRNV
uniref:Protein kinase domain-containing protein n=1 Tax=Fagus sylvatica TaxID=28930 RepID=A0A2N9IPU1_FAGSY